MPAGRKPDSGKSRGVDAEVPCAVTDESHRPLRIGKRNVCAIGPAFARQPVKQDEGGEAVRCQPAREAEAFLVDGQMAIGAAGNNQQSRTVRLDRAEDDEARPGYAAERTIVNERVGRSLHQLFHWQHRGRARWQGRPQVDRKNRLGQQSLPAWGGGGRGGQRRTGESAARESSGNQNFSRAPNVMTRPVW